MKRLSLGALALLGLFGASCSAPAYENNHWHLNSVPARISYHAAGYRQSQDGPYLQKVCADMDSVTSTLRRHLVHANEGNPLLPQEPLKAYRPEPPKLEFKIGE
ncbi:MAG: hypothetical protein FJ298_11180 [Planctomycetes bacterium]|nr:hypothetical protein [Planctomycetota bacterium]